LCPFFDVSPTSLVDLLSFIFFSNAPPAPLLITRMTLLPSVSSSESPSMVTDYTMKPLMTQFYSRRGARLSDAPPSLDELSSDASSSSSFVQDVTSSPSIEPSSLTDSSLE
jgi:hypothetical protein